MQLDAPIIIVGAGRSGSTLLDRMLDAHSAISMLGETNFITATLWKSVLDRRKRMLLAISDPDLIDRELTRLGKVELHTVGELFELASITKPFWGMKEIWNGAKRVVDWSIYDRVYPRATWVHLVRNPLEFARSAVGWTGVDMNEESLAIKLRTWLRMADIARERASTGRYVEMRYEDLVANPEAALAPLFSVLGLPYSQSCSMPMAESWVPSRSLPHLPEVPLEQLIAEAGLLGRLEDFGYEVCSDGEGKQTIRPLRLRVSVPAVISMLSDRKVIADNARCRKLVILESDEMSREEGLAYCYWAPLLAVEGDDPVNPHRSSYVLLEDEQVIGTPHTVHSEIREKGRGLWSHWGQNIFFSSSDGTDPRQNGREYALMKLQHESQVRGGDV
jgi:hypothetical protein